MKRLVKWSVLAGVIVLVLAAVFAVFRGMICLGMSDPFLGWRPSMADLLDGRQANTERLDAISKVKAHVGRIRVAGAHPFPVVMRTSCVEGQNNWKVHDGYRLKCSAYATTGLTWSGDYTSGKSALVDTLERSCDGPYTLYDLPPEAPKGTGFGLATVRCTNGLEMNVRSMSPQAPVEDVRQYFECSDDAQSRCVGPPVKLNDEPANKDQAYFFIIGTNSVFYEDKV